MEEFVKTGKQKCLWQAIERLIVSRLKQKRIPRSSEKWDDGFSEIFLLIAGAYSRWDGAGGAEGLYRYLAKTANSHSLFYRERLEHKHVKRYCEVRYRELANDH